MATYQYQALNPQLQQIRVLLLEPAADPTAIIRATLEVHDIQQKDVSYAALSYVWGNENDVTTMELGTCPFDVRVNLYSALAKLRSIDSVLNIWADAICINQKNNQERNHQVSFMGEIYDSARVVIVWLGSSDNDSKLAIDLIKLWASIELGSTPRDFARSLSAYPNAFDDQAWGALKSLMHRPWWSRVWTYQEYVRARAVRFFCGTDSFDESHFSGAIRNWKKLKNDTALTGLKSDQIYQLQLTDKDVEDFQSLYIHRGYRHTSDETRALWMGEPMNLLKLQRITHQRESSDPRDKLYAIRGVDQIRDISVVPDYGKPVEDVYRDFTKQCILSKNSLDIIDYAGIGISCSNPSLKAPSWVPDFRASAKWSLPLAGSGYCADGNISTTVQINENDWTLRCEGFVVETLAEVLPHSEWPMHNWSDYVLRTRKVNLSGVPRLQMFFRMMILDSSRWDETIFDSTKGKKGEQFYEQALGFMFVQGTYAAQKLLKDMTTKAKLETVLTQMSSVSQYATYFSIFEHGVPDPFIVTTDEMAIESFLGSPDTPRRLEWPFATFRRNLDEKKLKSLGWKYASQASGSAQNRAMFDTHKGYMGLGPAGSRVRDKLCILFGSKTPVILRDGPDGQYYQVVGTCHVYGLMHAEAIDDMQKGLFTRRTFNLR